MVSIFVHFLNLQNMEFTPNISKRPSTPTSRDGCLFFTGSGWARRLRGGLRRLQAVLHRAEQLGRRLGRQRRLGTNDRGSVRGGFVWGGLENAPVPRGDPERRPLTRTLVQWVEADHGVGEIWIGFRRSVDDV